MQQNSGQQSHAQETQDAATAPATAVAARLGRTRGLGRRYGSGLAGPEHWDWDHWVCQSGARERGGWAGAGSARKLLLHDARSSAIDALPVCPLPMSLTAEDSQLLQQLVEASHTFDGSGQDAERNCWLAVHQHVHGMLPAEYDIREVPEDLYLAVLALRRSLAGEG